jgi:hypothetical protein
LRLLAWRAPGGPDRERQMVRAVDAMTTLIGLTLVFEWAAVIGGAHASSWGTWTSVLIGGLVVASTVTVVATALLVRCRRHGSSGRWRHDWLGDVVLVCERFQCCGAGPPRKPRPGDAGETSVVAGCVAIQVALAFRNALWPAIGAGSPTSVPALVALTLGAGLVTSLVTAASSRGNDALAAELRRTRSRGMLVRISARGGDGEHWIEGVPPLHERGRTLYRCVRVCPTVHG